MSGLPAEGWRPRIRGALSAGLAGGVVLAGLLTAAVTTVARPAVRPAEALWLWPTLTLVAAPLLALLILAAVALVSRAGRALASASLVVGLVVLTYLVLLWWRGGRGAGGVASAIYLLLAAGVASLAAWLCFRFCARGPEGGDGGSRSGRRNWTVAGLALVALVALVAAAFLAGGNEPVATQDLDAAPFEVRPTAGRLLFIGVDGLDSGLVRDFAARGTLTRLLEGMRGGATFPLARAEGVRPHQAWSGILTGVPAVETDRAEPGSGGGVPVIAAPSRGPVGPSPGQVVLRFLLARSPASHLGAAPRPRRLWEIVALRDSAVSIGWPQSWPAASAGENATSLVVSEKLLPALLAGAETDRVVWPESSLPVLGDDFVEDRAMLLAEFSLRFPVAAGTRIRQLLWESFLIDGYRWQLARRVGIAKGARAVFVHFPGLDILRSRLLTHGAERELHTLLEISEALELYVRWLDGLLGDALQAPPGWYVALVGDPGRDAAGGEEGFLVVRGWTVRAGCVGSLLAPLDVAPLALELLGFPPSSEMPGRVPEQCLATTAPPRTPVQTYGRRSAEPPVEVAEENAPWLDRLRALGYLE